MSGEEPTVAVRARLHAALGDPTRLAIVDALQLGDASPGDLAADLRLPTNLLAHHLKVLEESGLIGRSRSEGDRRRTYVHVVAEALAALGSHAVWSAPRVVFVCTHNSARSQLAAALWSHRSQIPTASAGTKPAQRIHPRAVRVAHRHGLELAGVQPTHVSDVLRSDDLLVAVCDNAHERLPMGPQRRLHWSVADPAVSNTDRAFRDAYADLAARVERLAGAVESPGRR